MLKKLHLLPALGSYRVAIVQLSFLVIITSNVCTHLCVASVTCCLSQWDSKMLFSLASELYLLSKWECKSLVITILWVMKASSYKYAGHSVMNAIWLNSFCLDGGGGGAIIYEHVTDIHITIQVFKMRLDSLSLGRRHIKSRSVNDCSTTIHLAFFALSHNKICYR